jgi:hypothetical protein
VWKCRVCITAKAGPLLLGHGPQSLDMFTKREEVLPEVYFRRFAIECVAHLLSWIIEFQSDLPYHPVQLFGRTLRDNLCAILTACSTGASDP